MRGLSCARISFCMQLHQCHNSHERWQQYEAYFLLAFRECLQSTTVVSGGKGHLSLVIEDCFHIASVTRLISAAWHLVSDSQKWAIGTCLMAFVSSSNQMASGSSLAIRRCHSNLARNTYELVFHELVFHEFHELLYIRFEKSQSTNLVFIGFLKVQCMK